MNKLFLIFVFLCGLYTNNLLSQNLNVDSTIQANVCFKKLISYEKEIFNSTNADSINTLLLKKSYVYKEIHAYDKAISTLERIYFQNLNDSSSYIVYYEMAINAYLAGRFTESISFCDLIIHSSFKANSFKPIYLLLALSNNELANYDEGLKYSLLVVDQLQSSSNQKDSLKLLLENSYCVQHRPHFLNPSKAQTLSAILPGLGQCYSGYYAEGVSNFVLHAIVVSVTGYAIYKTYYLTSYFGGISLLMKFYTGGTRRSEFLANKRNYEQKQNFSLKIKKILIQNCCE